MALLNSPSDAAYDELIECYLSIAAPQALSRWLLTASRV